MEISFCPQAIEWGSLVDWVNVGIAALVGGAVLLLGRNTNRLAQAANQTNAFALRLEKETAERQAALDEREGKLLLLYIYTDILMLSSALTHVFIRFPGPQNRSSFVDSYEYRQAFCTHAGSLDPGAIAVKLDRAHVLEDGLAGRLHQIVGSIQALKFTLQYALIRAPGNPDAGDDFDDIWATLEGIGNNVTTVYLACDKVVDEFGLREERANPSGRFRPSYGLTNNT